MPDPPAADDQTTVCLITGATRGLGRAVAAEMFARGTTVVITGRDSDAAAKTAEEIGGTGHIWALPAALDIAVRDHVNAAAALVDDKFGRLDVLINNAAAFVDWTESATSADLDRSRAVMDTNLYGT